LQVSINISPEICFHRTRIIKILPGTKKPCTRGADVSTRSAPLSFCTERNNCTCASAQPIIGKTHEIFCAVFIFLRRSPSFCNLASPCARDIKFLLIAAGNRHDTKARTAGSDQVAQPFLSLAKPLTGCPKSQKYLKVCSWILSSNALSVSKGNFRDRSILVVRIHPALILNFHTRSSFKESWKLATVYLVI
jgi:hypothetical protein